MSFDRPAQFAFLLALILLPFSLAAQNEGYFVSQRFDIGGEGGWDYVTFDGDGGRLFVTRGSHVMVVDASTGKVLGDIPDTPGVHGVAIAPEFALGFASDGRGGTVSAFDMKSLKKTAEIKAGENPDAILFDPKSRHVFAFNGRSHDATVIEAAKLTPVATIPLGGKPEFAVSDLRGHVFVNVEDTSEIAEIDVSKNSVVARWPLKDCEDPTGLAIDRANGRLFSVCSNQKMTVLDAASGKLVATVPIGRHPDGAEYDPESHLVFSSNGEGTLTVVRQDSPDKYTVAQTLPTAVGARTMALDTKSHVVYLITGRGSAVPPAGGASKPGAFEVIVVRRK